MSTATNHITALSEGVWSVDPDRSQIGFAVKVVYGLQTVRGVFAVRQGRATVRARQATGELTIDAGSLDTGNRQRDRHLLSADFFDVERHPEIVFTTTAVSAGDRGLTIAGALTIGSAARRVEIPVDVEWTAGGALRLDGCATISRAAAGIAWNRWGMIRDATQLHAQLTLIPAAG